MLLYAFHLVLTLFECVYISISSKHSNMLIQSIIYMSLITETPHQPLLYTTQTCSASHSSSSLGASSLRQLSLLFVSNREKVWLLQPAITPCSFSSCQSVTLCSLSPCSNPDPTNSSQWVMSPVCLLQSDIVDRVL